MAIHSKHNLLHDYQLQAENRTSIILEILDNIEKDNHFAFSFIDEYADPTINLPLSHLLFSVKDNIMIKDTSFSAGSNILDGFVADYTATAVSKMLDEGATFIGKTVLDEFAIGTLGNASDARTPINPLDKEYMTGGSSSGAAVSVAANLCHVALASDTGGSARIPAAMTGVLGFKPSYGSVSRHGLLSFAPGYDQISFLSKNIQHIKDAYVAARGQDEKDMTSVIHDDYKFRGHTIGVLNLDNMDSLSDEVIDNYNSYIDYLMDLGFMISEVEIPALSEIIAAYLVLTSAESTSNLSRFTGIQYGKNLANLNDNRTDLIRELVKNRILIGNYLLTQDTNSLIKKAETFKADLSARFEKIFSEVDVFISPTTPMSPLKLDEKSDNTHFLDSFCCIANLIGAPSLVFPYGEYACGLPQSIQIISPQYSDICLLDFYKEVK